MFYKAYGHQPYFSMKPWNYDRKDIHDGRKNTYSL